MAAWAGWGTSYVHLNSLILSSSHKHAPNSFIIFSPFQNDEVLDEHVTNIIANQHLAPPPAHAFVSNDEEECVGELDDEEFQSSGLGDGENVKSIGDDEEEYMCDINGEDSQSSGLADEDEEIKSICGDEECVGEKEYQSSGLGDDETSGGDDEECVGGGLNSYQSSDHGDEGCAKSNGDYEFVGYIKNEDNQSSEVVAEETPKVNSKKYGRWKIGAFVAVCSLVIISIAAGVGSSKQLMSTEKEPVLAKLPPSQWFLKKMETKLRMKMRAKMSVKL